MAKGRPGRGGAGSSAQAEWRRARAAARRAAVRSVVLVVAAGGLCVAGVAGGGRWLVVAAVVPAAVAWWWRPDPDPGRWARGAAGEVSTAARLERLSRRWLVLHDRALPGSRANVDHLVIGPTGVWAVDSKAARARLRVRRGVVWAGAHPIDTGPVVWEAEQAEALLGVAVTPIVAVHGVGLRRRGVRRGGVRVVPATRLVGRLRRGRKVLSRRDVAAIAARADLALPPAGGGSRRRHAV